MSLADHDKARTGDLITRVTSDIEAVQDFINSALLGIAIDVMTLIGMIGVMVYLNWRFTLIALSVSPVLFLVVYSYTRRIKSASRAVRKEEGLLLSIVCTRSKYTPKSDTFVVSPANSRKVLGTFLKKAKKQLLIYDPKISDKPMRRILEERAKAGVEIKVIGSVPGHVPFEVQKLTATRLHTRTIIRDRRQAFVGSQSLRAAELDSRRELGVIVQNAKVVKTLIETFETDWAGTNAKKTTAPSEASEVATSERAAVSTQEAEKAVQVLTKELDPLAVSVKKAVRKAVAKAGDDVLCDKDIKNTMKKVVKKAVKEAVKEAVQDAKDAQELREAESHP